MERTPVPVVFLRSPVARALRACSLVKVPFVVWLIYVASAGPGPTPPTPSATLAPLTRARSSLVVELYHRSPFVKLVGSAVFDPTLSPGLVAFGLSVCLTPSANATAPVLSIENIVDAPT